MHAFKENGYSLIFVGNQERLKICRQMEVVRENGDQQSKVYAPVLFLSWPSQNFHHINFGSLKVEGNDTFKEPAHSIHSQAHCPNAIVARNRIRYCFGLKGKNVWYVGLSH